MTEASFLSGFSGIVGEHELSHGDPVVNRLARAIREAGAAGLSKTQVRDQFSRHGSKLVSKAWDTLVSTGVASVKSVPTNGRTAKRIVASGSRSTGGVWLTSLESAVMQELSVETRLSGEALARRAGLTRSDTRAAIGGLISKGLAELDGGGYVLSGGKPKKRRDVLNSKDVVEDRFLVLVGNSEERLQIVPSNTVDAFVLSPPFWKERDYKAAGQIGWEKTVEEFVARILRVLEHCARILRPHGLIFFNFDDHCHNGALSCIDSAISVGLKSIGLEKHREVPLIKKTHLPNGTDSSMSHAYEKLLILRRRGEKHYWDAYNARQDAKSGGKKRLSDVWEIMVGDNPHAKGKHFAAFSKDLVRQCLDVGVSEKGYCPACGAPWVRVLKRGVSTYKQAGMTSDRARQHRKRTGKAHWNNAEVTKKMADMQHVRWRPSCSHTRRKPVKPVIADPFLGSGTTGVVALERGYEFIGCEINEGYARDAAALLRTIKPSDGSRGQ